jgi:hypothetical protein
MMRLVISNLLGLAGAAAGGVLGFYTFGWLVGHGFYGLMIPGAFLGFGCSVLARHSSVARGVVCGVAALALALFAEWRFLPFFGGFQFPIFPGTCEGLESGHVSDAGDRHGDRLLGGQGRRSSRLRACKAAV